MKVWKHFPIFQNSEKKILQKDGHLLLVHHSKIFWKKKLLQIDKKGAMKALHYRKSIVSDINNMAKIRAAEWGTEEHWQQRITGYLNSQLHPQHALTARVCYVALKDATLIGFIAGHLSTRFNCDGELQWINVVKEQRRSGVALELLHLLAKWFAENEA